MSSVAFESGVSDPRNPAFLPSRKSTPCAAFVESSFFEARKILFQLDLVGAAADRPVREIVRSQATRQGAGSFQRLRTDVEVVRRPLWKVEHLQQDQFGDPGGRVQRRRRRYPVRSGLCRIEAGISAAGSLRMQLDR